MDHVVSIIPKVIITCSHLFWLSQRLSVIINEPSANNHFSTITTFSLVVAYPHILIFNGEILVEQVRWVRSVLDAKYPICRRWSVHHAIGADGTEPQSVAPVVCWLMSYGVTKTSNSMISNMYIRIWYYILCLLHIVMLYTFLFVFQQFW